MDYIDSLGHFLYTRALLGGVLGVYKPRVRCYETAELAMKFERAMDCEVVQFQILSEDWRKVFEKFVF